MQRLLKGLPSIQLDVLKIEDDEHPRRLKLIRLIRNVIVAQCVVFAKIQQTAKDLAFSKLRESKDGDSEADKEEPPPIKIGIVGGGGMSKRILMMLIDNGFEPSNIFVSTRRPKTLTSFSKQGVHVMWNNLKIASVSDVMYLAVLPHHFQAVAKELRGLIKPQTLIVNIMCSVPDEKVANGLDSQKSISPHMDQKLEGFNKYLEEQEGNPEDYKLDSETFCLLSTAKQKSNYIYRLILAVEGALATGAQLSFDARRVISMQTLLGSTPDEQLGKLPEDLWDAQSTHVPNSNVDAASLDPDSQLKGGSVSVDTAILGAFKLNYKRFAWSLSFDSLFISPPPDDFTVDEREKAAVGQSLDPIQVTDRPGSASISQSQSYAQSQSHAPSISKSKRQDLQSFPPTSSNQSPSALNVEVHIPVAESQHTGAV